MRPGGFLPLLRCRLCLRQVHRKAEPSQNPPSPVLLLLGTPTCTCRLRGASSSHPWEPHKTSKLWVPWGRGHVLPSLLSVAAHTSPPPGTRATQVPVSSRPRAWSAPSSPACLHPVLLHVTSWGFLLSLAPCGLLTFISGFAVTWCLFPECSSTSIQVASSWARPFVFLQPGVSKHFL